MGSKSATVIVYRSDRTLWTDGALRCRVVELFGPSSPRVLLSRTIAPVVQLDLDLPFDSGQAYGISIDSSGHRSGWHVMSRRSFLRVDGAAAREVDSTIVRPMLVPRDPRPSDLGAAYQALEDLGSPFARFGAQRFATLTDIASKLAFLNLEAKLRETRVGTQPLLSYVRDVREAAPDRVFLFMAAEVRQLIKDSPDFADAPGHDAPSHPFGLPAHPVSGKHTKYDFGNLQLSFSEAATPHPTQANAVEPCFSVDCDIDLERDLGHAFEFIHNHVFDKKTDQTLVYRMLWDQGILPAYHLVQPAGTPARAFVRVDAAVTPRGRGRRRAAKRSRRPHTRKAAAKKRGGRKRTR
jgi:hypothetical protein